MQVSVIIPTFNAENVIYRAISSIKSQKDIDDIEIIVVDDCSKDNTKNIALDHQCKLINVSKNSGGPNKGRNIGLREARGEYICFLDQDDEFLPNKLITQLNAKSDISFTDTIFNNEIERKRYIMGDNNGKSIFYGENEAFKYVLMKNNNKCSVMISSLMIHKRMKKIFFEEKYGMVDFDYKLRLLEHNEAVRISIPLIRRNVGISNLSLENNYRMKDYLLSKEIYQNYQNLYFFETKLGLKRLEGTMARYYYRIGNMKMSRKYLKNAELSWKTIAYYITSFFMSKFVNKHFKVFGT